MRRRNNLDRPPPAMMIGAMGFVDGLQIESHP
jgi:hypothetical protein